MSSWLDYTINGLIVGNVYALVAVGLALIFGVSRLINFAQGSIYLVGAYIGWVAVVQLHTPLPLTIIFVAVAAALVGLIIERFAIGLWAWTTAGAMRTAAAATARSSLRMKNLPTTSKTGSFLFSGFQ